MQTMSLRLMLEVAPDVRETLVKNLFWIDRGITGVELSGDVPPVLTVTCTDDSDADEIEAQVLADVTKMVAQAATVCPRTVYETQPCHGEPLAADEVCRRLEERGWLSMELSGSHVYAGLMAELYYGLDRAFGRRARGLGAQEVHLPSLLGADTLVTSGYLHGNAHMGNYVFHLHEDRSAVARFTEKCVTDTGGIDLSGLETSADVPEAVLSPAACQPVYRMLAGRTVATPFVTTGYVRCYRYESGATHGLRRSREFGVREIVYVGTERGAADFRAQLIGVAREFLDRFELWGSLVTASDPFFTDTSADYRVYQLALELKHEVQLGLGGDRVAAASVNQHGDHFGRAWDIRAGNTNERAHSCCMGFGIDRWCLAVFSQFGFDVRSWPRALREVVGV
ncbi:aminoacyl--tRNA ligase-related protein [Streptomyces sp. NPDC056347]|uniref:aminoacyl--tRNA ligase-related protein n=1 Tax=Streptomyces sp. NPDC056347 TaxID=3345790 RepID=UPI0035DBF9EA